jgi:hypothetical protein
LKLEIAKKGKKTVVNSHKRPLPNRAPKKGNRIEYQWYDKGIIYKKGLVERGGKNTMKIKWDEEGLQATVDVKGKEGWWFFEAGNAKRRKTAWKPPVSEEEDVVDKALTRSIPRFMKSDVAGPPPKGKHKVVRFYQREHFKIGGPTMDCVDRLGCNFTTHIRFTKKHNLWPKKHICRLQRIELKKGHPAAPPKNIDCLVFWIKINVKDAAAPYGGDFKSHSLIVCHFNKKLAGSTTAMPLFEVGIADVKKFDKGLLCKLCGMVGLVKALGIKFDKFCEGFEKPKEVDIPKTLTELKSPVSAAAPSPAGYETPNSGRGMRIKIESARIKGYLPKSSLRPQVDDGQGLAESAIVIADDEAKLDILKQKVDSQRRKIEHLESELQEERVELASALKRVDTVKAQRESHITQK